MTDPMQTAVEVLARELSCDTEEEWADRVNWPEAAAGAETFRVEARRILAEIAPLIRAEESEACAKLADAEADMRRTQQQDAKRRNAPKEARDFESMAIAAIYIAAAIRQRGDE